MLVNSRKLTAWNVRKNDVWTRNRLLSKEKVETRLVELITAGYTIVDAPASGDIDLTAETNSLHKYVVVWQTNDPQTEGFNINLTKTMTDSAGDIIANDGDVVILGIKINNYNEIISFNLSLSLNLDSALGNDFANKIAIEFATVNLLSATSSGFEAGNMRYCVILLNYTCGLQNPTLEHSDVYTSGTFGGIYISMPCDFTDVYFFTQYEISFNVVSTLNITNSFFACLATRGFFQFYGGGIINFQNVLFKDMRYIFSEPLVKNDNQSIIYSNNSEIDSSFINYQNTSNYFFKSTSKTELDFLDRFDTLDIAAIQTASNYKTLAATVVQERRSFRGTLGRIKRQYYNVQFEQDKLVDPDFKYFDDDDLLIVKREEEEIVLISDTGGPRKIKNLTFYENDGTTEYNYRNDENFLIIADDGTGTKAVFAWYKGTLRPTVFTDVWDDTVYTIENVFQIWRPPADVSIRNMWMTNDGPLAGNVLYEDLTSVVVIP